MLIHLSIHDEYLHLSILTQTRTLSYLSLFFAFPLLLDLDTTIIQIIRDVVEQQKSLNELLKEVRDYICLYMHILMHTYTYTYTYIFIFMFTLI